VEAVLVLGGSPVVATTTLAPSGNSANVTVPLTLFMVG
jgi:hypothetical protein